MRRGFLGKGATKDPKGATKGSTKGSTKETKGATKEPKESTKIPIYPPGAMNETPEVWGGAPPEPNGKCPIATQVQNEKNADIVKALNLRIKQLEASISAKNSQLKCLTGGAPLDLAYNAFVIQKEAFQEECRIKEEILREQEERFKASMMKHFSEIERVLQEVVTMKTVCKDTNAFIKELDNGKRDFFEIKSHFFKKVKTLQDNRKKKRATYQRKMDKLVNAKQQQLKYEEGKTQEQIDQLMKMEQEIVKKAEDELKTFIEECEAKIEAAHKEMRDKMIARQQEIEYEKARRKAEAGAQVTSILNAPERKLTEFECPICGDDFPGSKGLICECGGIYCHGCLNAHVFHILKEGAPKTKIFCPVCLCKEIPILQLQVYLEGDKFKEITKFTENCRIEEANRIAVQKYIDEQARLSQIDKILQRITNVLSNKCPACGAVFSDFDACCAVRCESCPKFFCGCCLKVHGDVDSIHDHATVCTGNGSPFLGKEAIEERHSSNKAIEVAEILKGLVPSVREEVLQVIRERLLFKDVISISHINHKIGLPDADSYWGKNQDGPAPEPDLQEGNQEVFDLLVMQLIDQGVPADDAQMMVHGQMVAQGLIY